MELGAGGTGLVFQPWNQILWPSPDVSGRPFGWRQARSIPGLAKAVLLISGVIRQMPMDDVKHDEVLTRPRILEKPDPDMSRSRFVGALVEDYLLHGNAVAVVTSRGADGWPASISYVPARHVTLEWSRRHDSIVYRVGDRLIPGGDVIHVARGVDPEFPWRGQGVLEQHLEYLGRADEESSYSRNLLRQSGVPSVVVVTPNPEVSQEEADLAGQAWQQKFGGPVRRPAILPAGTQVIPLSWSPADSQLVEARKLTKNDLADMFGLDGYWLGVESAGLNYRSPAPLYLNLIRQTVEPIAQDIEQPLSDALLPHGRGVRFDRSLILRDDMAAEIRAMVLAESAGLYTWEEARARLGMSADPALKPEKKPIPAGLEPTASTMPAEDPEMADEKKARA